MVTALTFALPLLAVLVLWFAGTGLIAWLNNRSRQGFARILIFAGLFAMAGLGLIVASLHSASLWAPYASFVGGMLIWSWHEVSFLTGAVSGSHRDPCPDRATRWERFQRATAALIHHEVALAMTALLLLALCWNALTPTGATLFLLLFLFRLSAKLNIFAGVPNFSDELMPLHLAYLKSYFGPRRMGRMLPVSLAMIAGLTAAMMWWTVAAPTAHLATHFALLAAICIFALLEHAFLALPFQDSRLWQWATALPTDKQELNQESTHGL